LGFRSNEPDYLFLFFTMAEETPRENRQKALILGVTGGIASGKTTVARMLQDLGAPLIDFDHLSRVVVEPGKPAWKQVVEYFGREILLPDQTINRKMLGAIVFSDPPKRKRLEDLLHPKIYEEYRRQIQTLILQHPNGIIQAVVPLLIEANLQSWFHKVLLVYVPEEIQVQRLVARDQINREKALQIIRCQLPMEEKRGRADYIVDNSGTPEETRRQVQEIWEKLKAVHARPPVDPGP
jgi:dephospho-CoA kinase